MIPAGPEEPHASLPPSRAQKQAHLGVQSTVTHEPDSVPGAVCEQGDGQADTHDQACVRAAERYKVLAEHRCQEK